MKIQLFSDIHLEFSDFTPDCSGADVVVFAGDLATGVKGAKWLLQLPTRTPVLYVAGNHEFYGNTCGKLQQKIRELLSGSHVHFLDNDKVVIDGVSFFGCTLWTDFKLFGNPSLAAYTCKTRLNDYNKIRTLPNYSRLTPEDTLAFHRQSISWLEQQLLHSTTSKNVVVTHHAPSIKSIPEQYECDTLSTGFASDLEGFISQHQPDIWLHGHVHTSNDYTIEGCRVVCNPRGYNDENADFSGQLLIDL
ncbi:metallophosphoesterase [Endozoicomonas lisbonensis]|uniref:Icc-related predicted phosphoesterase n=1 Tax=Endozoicomonas lisbonensis TaxID=3120522 RepID=A0ABV2SD76_9GAMM